MHLSACAVVVFAGAAMAGATGCSTRVHLGAIGDGGSNMLWFATFEPGDLSEWTADGGGGVFVQNATGGPIATTEMAHDGAFCGKAIATPTMGMDSYNYFLRQQPAAREAYYSAWFFVPPNAGIGPWLSILHFRGSHTADGRNVFPLWDLNLYAQSSGGIAAQLYHFATMTNRQQTKAIPVPLGRWVHFEMLIEKAAGATGRVAVWQDGMPIFDLAGVATTENDWLEWDVGAAADTLFPGPATVYVDDAAISVNRLGPLPRLTSGR